MKRNAGQWQHHTALLQDDVAARLMSPCTSKRGMPSPSSVASIECDAVTSTPPLLANVIISNTTSWLLSEFFWNLVAPLLSDRCCLCLHFCSLMLLPLALATAGWLLLKYFFGMWWHCRLHAHWLFLLPLSLLFLKFLPSRQLLFLLYQFAARSLTNCIERIVADVAAAVPHRLVWFATEQREGRGVAWCYPLRSQDCRRADQRCIATCSRGTAQMVCCWATWRTWHCWLVASLINAIVALVDCFFITLACMPRLPASCLHEMPAKQLSGSAEPHILVFCLSECEEVKEINWQRWRHSMGVAWLQQLSRMTCCGIDRVYVAPIFLNNHNLACTLPLQLAGGLSHTYWFVVWSNVRSQINKSDKGGAQWEWHCRNEWLVAALIDTAVALRLIITLASIPQMPF